uniref:Uncharacterized protein n=1 Tax=Plasmid R100 TaxID=28399 RepID=Q46711_9ZZZZ|nr:unknown protein [Plasmid R100]
MDSRCGEVALPASAIFNICFNVALTT